MASMKHLEDQARSLMTDQKALLDDNSRSWADRQEEFDKRKGDIKAVLDQHAAMKAVSGGGFNHLDQLGSTSPGDFGGTGRALKGVQAGLVAQGYQATGTPQMDIPAAELRELQQAAVSGKSYGVNIKAATDSTAVSPAGITDYKVPPVPVRREPTRVLSLVPTFATTQPSVTWYSTTGTAAADAVAEGAAKPMSTIAYTPRTGTVTKLAHVVEVTDETLADFPSFLSVLELDMFDGVVMAENAELLNATVTGAHKFPGLLNTSGILVGTPVPATPTQNDRLDAIGAAVDQLRVGTAYTEPDGMILHPTTWGTIKRNKDSQGRYLLSDPGSPTDPRIWGVPVVLSTQMPVGTVLVGDFAGSTAAYIREGLRVEASSAGEAQFKNNTTLVRAEERLLLTVPRPMGLIKVSGF